jgi:hypothetical protein
VSNFAYTPGYGDWTREYNNYTYVEDDTGDYSYNTWVEEDLVNGYLIRKPYYQYDYENGTHRQEAVYEYDLENGNRIRTHAYEYDGNNGSHILVDVHSYDPVYGYYSFVENPGDGEYSYNSDTNEYYYDPDYGTFSREYDAENGNYVYCHQELVPNDNGYYVIVPDEWLYQYDYYHGDYSIVDYNYILDENGDYVLVPGEWEYEYVVPGNGEYVDRGGYIYTPGVGDYDIDYNSPYYRPTPGEGDYTFTSNQYIYTPGAGYLNKYESCEIIEYIGKSSAVVVPETLGGHTVTSLGQNLFNYLTAPGVTSITLPETLVTINYRAFGYTSITSLHIPASVTQLYNNPFGGASKLQTVTFGEGSLFVCENKVIYDAGKKAVYAFLDTYSDITYTLPDTLEDFSSYMWSGTGAAGDAIIQNYATGDNPNFTAIDGVLFTKDMKHLVAYPIGNTRTAYTVPNGVEQVGETSNYSYNSNLRTVTIPEGVTTLHNPFGWSVWEYDPISFQVLPTESMIYNISSTVQHIFESGNCNMNGGFNVNPNNPYFTSIDGVLYNKNVTTLLAYPDHKNDVTYTIPATVTKLSAALGRSPFINTRIKELTLSANLESVVPSDFQWLDNLNSFIVPNGNTQLAAIDGVLYSKDRKFLISYPRLKWDSTYTILPGTEWVNVYDNLQPFTYFLQEVTFPGSVKVIGGYMTWSYNGQYLTSLTLKGSNDYTRRWASYFGYNFIRVDATVTALETVVDEAIVVLTELLDVAAPLDRDTMTLEQFFDVTGVIELFDALSDVDKTTVDRGIIDKVEEAREAIAQINHADNNVSIVGADWNIRVEASEIISTDSSYATAVNVAGEETDIVALYDIKLTKNNATYNLPGGQKITVTINGDFSEYDKEARDKLRIYHLKENLTSEYIKPISVTNDTITFRVATFSLFGVAMTELPDGKGDINDDGEIDGRDVTYLARYLAEWSGYSLTNESAADVNGDGNVDGRDVTYLARYLAEWAGYSLD